MMNEENTIIGIDFGTTNCTLSYIRSQSDVTEAVSIELLEIKQPTAAKETQKLPFLPSFIYFPLAEEIASQVVLPQRSDDIPFTIGTYAKERGEELPCRLIASPKSWLCHSGINRREKILPIEAEEKQLRLSPVEACSEILQALKEAWNGSFENAPFEDQSIFVTVPASFDPAARKLVEEAAKQAGFPEIVLLEEPQAAFYSWLYSHEKEWRKQLKVGDCVLVIDIGGGTTDFSLIAVEEEGGDLQLKRKAVGQHLLLGGDNIDLCLAYLAKQKLEEKGASINDWQMLSLVHQCREAKENLLSENPSDHWTITLLGRGSRLIGSTVTVELSKAEVIPFIIEGFIPLVDPSEPLKSDKHVGVQQIGLPFAKDPRISAHLAQFLSMKGESGSYHANEFISPTHVLFNGGTLKGMKLRERLVELLNSWAKKLNKPPVSELSGADLDFAVSRGAAYFGSLRQKGNSIRVKSGTHRSYFLGVEEAMPAVPGISPPLKAICIAPFGLEEGQELSLDTQEFVLLLGEKVEFRFFSHSTAKLSDGSEPFMGSVVSNWRRELTELPCIETFLEKGEGEEKAVKIKLKSKVTELGVLELWCVAENGRKWKLEMNTR